MARRATLKVYRTPTGFHDAYVAAPSQKAALKAWGSEHDLFARGVAELVTEPALMEEPLAHPGAVVKRLRGTAEEQIAALPKSAPSKRPPRRAEPEPKPKGRPSKKPAQVGPRPDRTALDAAERARAQAEARHKAEEKILAEKEARIARERSDLKKAHAAEARRLDRQRDQAARAYKRAIKKWQA